jgi:hypothetical protein
MDQNASVDSHQRMETLRSTIRQCNPSLPGSIDELDIEQLSKMAETFNDATSDSGTGLFLTLSCMLISRARYHASLDSALDRAETLVRSTPSDHPNYPRRAELRDQLIATLIATLKTKGGPEAEMAPDANLGASPGPLSAILCGATTHFERVVFVVWTHTQRKFASDVARTPLIKQLGASGHQPEIYALFTICATTCAKTRRALTELSKLLILPPA